MTVTYLFSPGETETGKAFRQQLCSRIGKVTDVSSVGPEHVPLVVIVQNFSRIGTDIDSVVTDLPDAIDKEQVAIVVLHVTAKHALPSLAPTSTLSDEKYEDYGCMVDFFFTQDAGIYGCRLNDEAAQQLKEFIKGQHRDSYNSTPKERISYQGHHRGSYNSTPQERISSQKGCMLCRMEVTITDWGHIQAGDQISMTGRARLLGNLYRHHAVVASIKNVSKDGQKAELEVFDVDNKGKIWTACRCSRESLPIQKHNLYNTNPHTLATGCICLSGDDAVVVRKVQYRRRKFDQSKVVERAEQCKDNKKNEDLKYCFFTQNCEHFASACANGPDDVEGKDLSGSMSMQTLDCMWYIISILFWFFQAAFYGFKLWMYGVFVQNDPDFDFLSNNDKWISFLNKTCNSEENNRKYFKTTCDGKLIGIFIAIFVFFTLCMVGFYYLPLYRKKLMCTPCFITVLINWIVSRNAAFVIIEIINILAGSALYKMVTNWHLNRFATVLMTGLVSALGAIWVYSLASVFTKGILWLFGKRWESIADYHEYVPFKGCVWCLCKLRCCNTNTKSKYLVEHPDEQQMEQSV